MNSALPREKAREEAVLDPVAAYDRLASHYSQFSDRRAAYLSSVEKHILSRIPKGFASLLDIGAADGSRPLRIASAAKISRVVLLEPSSRMSAAAPATPEVWRTRAEELRVGDIHERFDAITCLWNVIGHIPGHDKRIRTLTNTAPLLSPEGLLFIDVIHRYNVRSYGMLATASRWLRDHIAPADTNGDVVASWKTGAGTISTYGHVFTDREMRRMAESAGLECVERVVIDYDIGVTRRFACMGNLLYIFRRNSRSDFSNALQTS